MTLALTFVTPLLLAGVLAAGIPLLLHLLSNVRAREVLFPTLRLLRLTMEKTARRRRIQHWLLLALRAMLLAALAVAAAEPVSRAAGDWLGGGRHAAVIVLDNSMSMAVRQGQTTRFAQAKAQAASMLAGDDKPALAALVTTNGEPIAKQLTARLDTVRERISRVTVGFQRAPLAQRVAAAADLIRNESIPNKAIYLFSDMQRISFDELASLDELAKAENVHLLVINTAVDEVNNVGISDLSITGVPVVDQVLEFTATLVNSSPTESVAAVSLRVGGRQVGRRVNKKLRACGRPGSSAGVRFYHRLPQPGAISGEVILDRPDDLAADNVRRFAVKVGPRVMALIVHGPTETHLNSALGPAAMLRVALDPYGDDKTPWSVRPRLLQVERFAPGDLADVDVAFFCDVPSFTADQARAIEQFVRKGGSAAFFLGEQVQPANYNALFIEQIAAEGGMLPLRLVTPTGQIGPAAAAVPVDWVDQAHPYFQGLYESREDYLTTLIQRYFRLSQSTGLARVLMRLENGDPLLAEKTFGRGRVVLWAVPASPRWSNLPTTGLFLPVVVRMCLQARRPSAAHSSYLAGAKVTIRPEGGLVDRDDAEQLAAGQAVTVTPPIEAGGAAACIPVPLVLTDSGYLAEFSQTSSVGFYSWQLEGDSEAAGLFVVNPDGAESKLEALSPETFRQAMSKLGVERLYVAGSLAGVRQAAAADAKGRNWWDVLLAVVILLLVVEAIVANRPSRREAPPARPAAALESPTRG